MINAYVKLMAGAPMSRSPRFSGEQLSLMLPISGGQNTKSSVRLRTQNDHGQVPSSTPTPTDDEWRRALIEQLERTGLTHLDE